MSEIFPILRDRIGTFDHSLTDGQFKKLPSIYAIEATSACNLECPMCLRSQTVNKHPGLLDMRLLELMYNRGDFEGSSYVELQLSGEPTIHPKLRKLITYLRGTVGVLVGLSTHGLNMDKRIDGWQVAATLLELDALTISVDSVDPETYHKMRYPANLDVLTRQLDFFFKMCEEPWRGRLPFIELQLVRSSVVNNSGDIEALDKLSRKRGWSTFASIRTTNDCFYEMDGRVAPGTIPRNSNLCVNPWMDVNISQDGDVVSCCYIFDTDKTSINYYGNLYDESLEEIWNGPRVAAMREMHLNGTMKDACAKCYYKSPSLIHSNIVSRLVRAKGRW